jgi:tetratricopeptide (TPR) repeat protein
MIDNREEIERLRDAWERNPDDRDAGVRLAQVYVDIGWRNEAADLYQELRRRFGDDYDLLLEYGNLCFNRDDLDAAREVFARLTAIKPERLEGWNNLGIVELSRRDYEAARQAFERVLELEPGNVGALLNMGNYYDQRGDIDEAIDYFTRVTEARRDFADGWFNLGNACLKADKPHKAADCFERAIRYAPEFSSARKNLGVVRERLGDADGALEQYLAAREINKADPGLYVNIANIYAARQRWDEAKDHYLRAVRLAPKHAAGWMGLRRLSLCKGDIPAFVRSTLAILHRLESTEIADAVWRLRKLHHAARADEVLALADRLGKQGDELDAERLLSPRCGADRGKMIAIRRRLSSLEDCSDHIRACLAECARAEGDFDEAIRRLEAIAAPAPEDRRMLWDMLIERGELDRARELIEKSLTEDQDNFEAWFRLARIAAAGDAPADAREHLIRALESGFTDLGAIEQDPALARVYERLNSGNDRIL